MIGFNIFALLYATVAAFLMVNLPFLMPGLSKYMNAMLTEREGRLFRLGTLLALAGFWVALALVAAVGPKFAVPGS